MEPEFSLTNFVDRPELLGARWWNRSLQRRVYTRRALVAAAGLGAIGLLLRANLSPSDPAPPRVSSLLLQRERGWDLDEAGALVIPDARTLDVTESDAWRGDLGDLAVDLSPPSEWGAVYRPTLFQALQRQDAAGARLARALRPMSSDAMRDAFARGRALSAALADAPVLPVIDLDGPRSIAMAAGMVDRFFPVFVFDNWPHPRGCVPSHLTLAAALFFASLFRASGGVAGRSPAIVLDRARLAPAAGRFDNRYVAPMPSAAVVAGYGVLYVHDGARPAATESDDLNAWMVEQARGVRPPRALSIDDLQPCPQAPWLPALRVDGLTAEYRVAPRYCYGGDPSADLARVHGLSAGERVDAPPGVSDGYAYAPRPRRTIFGAADPSVAAVGVGATALQERPGESAGGCGAGSYSRGYGSFGG